MKSIDIKISNAKRRAEAERQQATPKPTPTMGLTIPRSTPEDAAPMRKHIQDLPRATELEAGHVFVISTPTGHDGLYPQWALECESLRDITSASFGVPPGNFFQKVAKNNTALTGTGSISPEGVITYLTGGVDLDLTTPETVRSIISEQLPDASELRSADVFIAPLAPKGRGKIQPFPDPDREITSAIEYTIRDSLTNGGFVSGNGCAGKVGLIRTRLPDLQKTPGNCADLFMIGRRVRDVRCAVTLDASGATYIEVSYIEI